MTKQTDQESIAQLLTRIYRDIFAIEEEFELLVGVDDFRPRIDYFHDAIRAFTSQDAAALRPGGRSDPQHPATAKRQFRRSVHESPFVPQIALFPIMCDFPRWRAETTRD